MISRKREKGEGKKGGAKKSKSDVKRGDRGGKTIPLKKSPQRPSYLLKGDTTSAREGSDSSSLTQSKERNHNPSLKSRRGSNFRRRKPGKGEIEPAIAIFSSLLGKRKGENIDPSGRNLLGYNY